MVLEASEARRGLGPWVIGARAVSSVVLIMALRLVGHEGAGPFEPQPIPRAGLIR
jgi:hypothetical protein